MLVATAPGRAHAEPAYTPVAARRESAAGEAWLAVTLNGSATDQTVLAVRDGRRLLLTAEDLKSFRLLLPRGDAISREGKAYYALEDIRGLTYRIDEPQQMLFIQAPASLFEPSTFSGRSLASATPPTLPPNGAFLNYDVVSSRIAGSTQTNALLEANVFGPLGNGLARFLEQDTGGHAHSVRMETTWTRDFPDTVTRLKLGDAVTGTSRWWGGAVRFGGVQWGTNFATRPDLITVPMPVLTGESVLPSTLDLYVNGALRMRQDAPPGPFTLQNVPIVTGQGDVRLVVTDPLGRQQVIAQSYYASPQMLQPGLSDYSYEAGVIRNNFGTSSDDYGRALLVGTHRVGLTSNVTGEFHGELLRDQQAAGIAGATLLPTGTVLSLGIAGSHSARGTGELATMGLEHTSWRFSFGANAQLASRDFVSLGLERNQLAPVRTLQTFASYTFGMLGPLAVSYTRADFRDRPSAELVSLSQGISIGQQGYLSLSVLRVFRAQPDTSANLTFTRSLGARTTGNVNVLSNNSGTQELLQVQQSLPVGTGVGYRISAANGIGNQRNAAISLQNGVGTYQLEVDSESGDTGERASASGSVALLDGAVFASRRIDDSFAVAQIAGRPGVRVYSDNDLVGTTNSRGYAFVPMLRSYQSNIVRVDLADLPLDFNVDAAQMRAVPYSRSGLMLRFPIGRAEAALISLVTENGEPLPPGATVILVGPTTEQTHSFPVGLNGETYVTGLAATNRLRASWPDHTCELDVSYSRNEDPWQRLGPFTCKEVASK